MEMRKPLVYCLIAVAAVGATLMTYAYLAKTYLNLGSTNMSMKSAVKLKEPLYISGNDPEQKAYYLLPPGTVLYADANLAEGHTRYVVYFNFKGQFDSETFDPKTISPAWLFNVEKDDVTSLLGTYPLSKNDLVKILKARKMTRDDLAQIVRDWRD